PELIFLSGRIEEGLRLRREMESLAIKVPVLGGDALYVAPRIKEEKAYSDGLMLTLFFHPDFEGTVVDAFVKNFRNRFGFTPDARAALTYDAVYLLKAAAEKSGASREAIRQGLLTVGSKRRPFQGVTGFIFFHKNGISADTLRIGTVKNGEVFMVG